MRCARTSLAGVVHLDVGAPRPPGGRGVLPPLELLGVLHLLIIVISITATLNTHASGLNGVCSSVVRFIVNVMKQITLGKHTQNKSI